MGNRNYERLEDLEKRVGNITGLKFGDLVEYDYKTSFWEGLKRRTGRIRRAAYFESYDIEFLKDNQGREVSPQVVITNKSYTIFFHQYSERLNFAHEKKRKVRLDRLVELRKVGDGKVWNG